MQKWKMSENEKGKSNRKREVRKGSVMVVSLGEERYAGKGRALRKGNGVQQASSDAIQKR